MTPAGPAAAPPTMDARSQRRTLVVASVSTMLMLVTFVTPLATGARTARALQVGPGTVPWLLSSMSVGLAAALLTAGVLADDLGRRRVFIAGLGADAAGAVLAATAQSGGLFVAGRIVQGLGAAAVLACALGLISHAFPPGPARGRATAVWGASLGAGTGVGSLLTVAVDHGTSWRGSYWLTAALAVLLAVAARVWLPVSVGTGHRRVDVPGVLTLAGGLSCLLAGLVQSRGGWTQPSVLVLLALGVLLLAGFVAFESAVRAPLIDLALFRVPGFAAASLTALVTGVAVIGLSSYLPTVVQVGLGEGLLPATLLIAAWSASSTLAAVGVRWLHGVEGRRLLVVGQLVSGAGLALLALLRAGGSSAVLLIGLIVLGGGYGVVNGALGREAVAHVSPAKGGMGSGANNTARYVGAALGVTAVVLVAGHGHPVGTSRGLIAGWQHATLAAAALSVLGGLAVACIRPRS